MGAIVRVATTTPRAAETLLNVIGDDPTIWGQTLGQSSDMTEVVFRSTDVEIGTGFVTLQRLMNEHEPGSGNEIVPVPLG